ncbi:MAG: oligosaccharide flippase family protein [Patescibacteria group bacterium]
MQASSLGKWQIVSLISRFSALFLGLVQSVVIARILSVSEFGLVGIVTSIGALAGIAQHLGLASGTTHQISSASKNEDIFKIFLSSLVLKYLITVPVAVGLFVIAPYIARNIYKYSELLFPLKIYCFVLIVQGVQSIFNSIIAGLQKFKVLFIYQAAIAFVSVFLYVPLVFLFRVNGFFIALAFFNLIGSIVLGMLALYPIRNHIKLPTTKEFGGFFKNIFVLSMGIYLVKVLYTLWVRFGQLTLPYFSNLTSVGIFSFAMLYASKLQTISDALTDVNLPYFSKVFATNYEDFKKTFHENFNKLYALIFFAGVGGIFFSKEVILIAVGTKYNASLFIILPLVLSFVFYSYINILKSSVLIPAKMLKEMILGYFLMLIGTVGSYFVLNTRMDGLNAMSFSMLIGGILGYFVLALLIYLKLKILINDYGAFLISSLLILILAGHLIIEAIYLRLTFFVFMSFIYLYFVDRLKLVNIARLFKKLKRVS